MFIQDTETLKAIVGGMNDNLTFELIMPSVEDAEFKHLRPVLGSDFMAWLDEHQDDTVAEVAELCRQLRRAVGHYTILEALPGLVARLGDAGVMEALSGNAQGVRQWVYQNYEIATAQKADVYFEAALEYLERHRSSFPEWTLSEACTVQEGQILTTATALSKFIATGNSRRAFLAFQPYLRRVEELVIGPAISPELLEGLKSRLASDETTLEDRALLLKLRPALAQLALAEAAPELAVNLAATGIVLLPDNLSVRAKLMASPEELSALSQKATRLGTKYMAEVRFFLDRNIAGYPEYAESDTYTLAGQAEVELFDNSGSKVFYVG